jgi:hypothetical protein
MAETYIETNRSSTKDLFRKRLAYNVKMNESSYKNLVDFNFGEKYLYGRVNRSFVPMIVNEDRAPIRKFDNAIVKARGLGALAFVVEAFNDLAQQFQKCAMTRKIDPADPYLSNLKVYKAYTAPKRAYGNYRKTYFEVVNIAFKRKNIKVRNFDEFTDHLMRTLEATAPRDPFTQPGFIKSRRAPVGCSGLVIEIADLDASNDQEKIDQFFNSKNWEFYLNACAAYGFMVDRRVPWRLVADIGLYPEKSPMLDYAGAYGLNSTNKIIDTYYKSAYLDYFQTFKIDLLTLYNKVKLRNFLVTEQYKGRTISKRARPIKYTAAGLFKKYTEEDFLTLYFKIRFFEEESRFTENQKSLMIDDCIELYQQKGLDTSLGSFERILNKTFDYAGSLGYIKKHLEALEAESFAESEGTTGATSATMGTTSGY